jgi:hypothetical protein
MTQRKDMGELPKAEFVPPKRTGKKAVVEMHIVAFVEVAESDDWNDMTNQAKDQLNKRVVEGKGFYPVSSKAERITTDATVEDFRYSTYAPERSRW